MHPQKILTLTLLLAREVARLHAQVAAQHALLEELRILDPRLAAVKSAQIQIDELQAFYEMLERFDPELAAMLDNRGARAFDPAADPEAPFPE